MKGRSYATSQKLNIMILRTINLNAKTEKQGLNLLQAALKGTGSSALVVQSFCQGMLQQPIFELPTHLKSKLPPINTYITDAKTHADYYIQTLQPKMIKSITDVGGYSQQFTSFYDLIDQRINTWKLGNEAAKTEALQLLQQLQSGINTKKEAVVIVTDDLGKFLTDLNGDVGNFATVVKKAKTVIGGDEGAITELTNQMESLDKQIAGAAVGVALSGLAIVGGIVLIIVGAVGEVFTGGASTAAIVSGIGVVATGIGGVTASSIALANLVNAKGDLFTQREQLQDDLKFLYGFNSNIGMLKDSAATAATQVGNMKNAWGILGNNMGNVIQSVQDAQSYSELPITVKAYLDTANAQWTSVKGSIQNVEKQLTNVKTKTVKSNGKFERITADIVRQNAA